MNPRVILITNEDLIVDILEDNHKEIIFKNPLSITYTSENTLTLEVPKWILCTTQRIFRINKRKLAMDLEPTPNLSKTYIELITNMENPKEDDKE
jgi:hypothetical protein